MSKRGRMTFRLPKEKIRRLKEVVGQRYGRSAGLLNSELERAVDLYIIMMAALEAGDQDAAQWLVAAKVVEVYDDRPARLREDSRDLCDPETSTR